MTVNTKYNNEPAKHDTPEKVRSFIGKKLKLKIPSYASLNNLLRVYLGSPPTRFSRSYSTPFCLNPIQLLMPRRNRLSSGILFMMSITLRLRREKSPESTKTGVREIFFKIR